MSTAKLFRTFSLIAAVGIQTFCARAQFNLAVYTDNLVNGFQDWGWDSTRNFSNPSPVHSGSSSIAVTLTTGTGALRFQQPSGLNPAIYTSVSFWINGGDSGGQLLRLQAVSGNSPINSGALLLALAPNTWQQYVVPLSLLGVSTNQTFNGFWLQGNAGSVQPTFYVDDVTLLGAPPPSVVNLKVDNATVLRAADSRWLGLNTAIWDSNFDTDATSNSVKELGVRILRFPGGSLSDEYHWASNRSVNTQTGTLNSWAWWTSFDNFMHIATNAPVQAFITVNYGTGTPAEAWDWVRYANYTNKCGFKYWEVGNEVYGSWETDWNTTAHDPYTYANRFVAYYNAMKGADPTIKIGAVATPDTRDYLSHTYGAFNARDGSIHYDWTSVMLYFVASMGVKPDFIVHHYYPEYQTDNDQTLLQASSQWASDTQTLRQMLTDYLGPSGANVEILCTENNSDSGSQGRQSTSIVNGLYLADSLAQLMKTEINSFVWWDLRNGSDTGGDFSSDLYGWRTYGDLGIMEGSSTKFPTYYAMKMMQYFVGTGDTVLNPSSDFSYLSGYATHKSNGNLALLVINKSLTNLNGRITLTNFVPSSHATLQSFGILQDEATRTNGPAAAQDISTTNISVSGDFQYSFPPYSLNLLTFSPFATPTAPLLQFISASQGKLVLQLQGQSNTQYAIQYSTDLINWTNQSTYTMAGAPILITNNIGSTPGRMLWRSAWQP